MIIPELRHRRITNANVDVLRRTLNDKLRRLVKETPMERRETLTIDISRYETINNTGLSALLHARSEALAAGFTEVQFAGMHETVRGKILSTGLADKFGITVAAPEEQ